MMISMYFAVSWTEPRLVINESAKEWTEDSTGPRDVSANGLNLVVKSLTYIFSKSMNLQKH